MSKPLIAITGASSGIGEATARTFSAAGHPLLLMARRIERMEAVKYPNTLKAYKDNNVRIGGRISADHVANMILFAYQMPQNVFIQEMVVTPTRQEY